MNLIDFLRQVVLRIKENHYTKKETETFVSQKIKDQIPGAIDGTSSIEAKNLNVNQELKTNNLELRNKVKSNVTPFDDNFYSLGSSAKAWKSIYLGDNKAIKFRTDIPNPNKPGEFLSINPLDIDGNELRIKYANADNDNCIKILPNYIHIVKQNGSNFMELLPDQFNIFGHPSSNSGEGAIQTLRLNSHHVRIDCEGSNGMIATNAEFSIIPTHGPFYENNIQLNDYNRIKFGGMELVAENDLQNIIFAYKPAGSYDEIVPFAITKSGKVYYNGKPLEEISDLYAHRLTLSWPNFSIAATLITNNSEKIDLKEIVVPCIMPNIYKYSQTTNIDIITEFGYNYYEDGEGNEDIHLYTYGYKLEINLDNADEYFLGTSLASGEFIQNPNLRFVDIVNPIRRKS